MHLPVPTLPAFPEAALADALRLAAAEDCPREVFLTAVRHYVERRAVAGGTSSATIQTLSELRGGVHRHLVRTGASRDIVGRASKLANEAMMTAVTHCFQAGIEHQSTPDERPADRAGSPAAA